MINSLNHKSMFDLLINVIETKQKKRFATRVKKSCLQIVLDNCSACYFIDKQVRWFVWWVGACQLVCCWSSGVYLGHTLLHTAHVPHVCRVSWRIHLWTASWCHGKCCPCPLPCTLSILTCLSLVDMTSCILTSGLPYITIVVTFPADHSHLNYTDYSPSFKETSQVAV